MNNSEINPIVVLVLSKFQNAISYYDHIYLQAVHE